MTLVIGSSGPGPVADRSFGSSLLFAPYLVSLFFCDKLMEFGLANDICLSLQLFTHGSLSWPLGPAPVFLFHSFGPPRSHQQRQQLLLFTVLAILAGHRLKMRGNFLARQMFLPGLAHQHPSPFTGCFQPPCHFFEKLTKACNLKRNVFLERSGGLFSWWLPSDNRSSTFLFGCRLRIFSAASHGGPL